MHRCLQLAGLAVGNVAPNPLVGAVLVHDGEVIGEGYHGLYGQAHAEVNCIASVKKQHQHLINKSTLYVSLEPCAHWGKTPPCTDLIVEKKIPKVIIGCGDPFSEVNGKGIEKLKQSGVQVQVGILEVECKQLNKRFFSFHEKRRPYVVLKWAEALNNKIAKTDHTRLLISNNYSNRIVHKWRSEEMAIVIGTNTALLDNPQLNTRMWPGKNPVRVVIDLNLRLPTSLQIFDGSVPTIIFNKHQHSLPFRNENGQLMPGVSYYKVTGNDNLLLQLLNGLYQLNVQSILVEGGARLLQSFIDEDLWDEARVITNQELIIAEGLASPTLRNNRLISSQNVSSDIIRTYMHANQ